MPIEVLNNQSRVQRVHTQAESGTGQTSRAESGAFGQTRAESELENSEQSGLEIVVMSGERHVWRRLRGVVVPVLLVSTYLSHRGPD